MRLSFVERLGYVNMTLDDFDRLGPVTPLVVGLKPSGENCIEEFMEQEVHLNLSKTYNLSRPIFKQPPVELSAKN